MTSSTPFRRAPPTHLPPSDLGNKSYWSDLYKHDLANHESAADAIGAIWFDDSDAETKVIDYLISLSEDREPDEELQEQSRPPEQQLGPSRIDKTFTSFLDLGTGNGHMLFELREEGGFFGPMVGIDYAMESVKLARRIAAERGLEDSTLSFESWDIMASSLSSARNGGDAEGLPAWVPRGSEGGEDPGFDVLLDKGTFDAISLSEETDEHGRRICEGYAAKVKSLMRKGGILVITSCNWTEEELRIWFETESETGETAGPDRLVMRDRIPYRHFRFGGRMGQTVSSLVFRREVQ